jgi:ElaB/YqjD/DUF883 family membrane-anchored ribosome-binding protein
MSNEKSSSVRQKTHNGVDKVMDRADIIRKGSREAMARIKAKAIQVKENVDGYIRKNPKKAVLIAAGAAAVVGAMVTAAMMRKKKR